MTKLDLVAVLSVGALLGLLAAPPSRATFAGANGLLVYQAQVGKHVQLFTIKPDRSNRRQLTHFRDSDAVWAAWSPDGRRIAFERDFANHAAIETMNANGNHLRSLTPHGINGEPSWSPDGTEITFGRYMPGKEASIWIMNTDGSHIRRVTTNPIPARDSCGGCEGQSSSIFSPDGKTIAFAWINGAHSGALYTVGVNGTGLHQVTPFAHGVGDKVDWSPDGSRLAFTSPEFGRPGKSGNVYTIHPDGTGLTQLTHATGGTINDGLDSWSPDGKQIAFVSNQGGANEIYLMNADGTDATRLTHGPESHNAAWGTHS